MLQGKRDVVLLLSEHLRLRRLLLLRGELRQRVRSDRNVWQGRVLHMQQRRLGLRVADEFLLMRRSMRDVAVLWCPGLLPQRRMRHLAPRTKSR